MGLSRNKVAVPEGAAGTTPFWRVVLDAARPKRSEGQGHQRTSPLQRRVYLIIPSYDWLVILSRTKFVCYSPIAQLVRALH